MSASAAEVARLFGAEGAIGINAGEIIYPGYPGLVVAEGRLRSMVWGFPLVMKSKRTGEPMKPKPVNNARTDKLGELFWRSSFEQRRCLIPVTAFAEAEGNRGEKTRTWFTLPEPKSTFACAGLWREGDEFGACYSMIMTDANSTVAPIHDRMPVILPEAEWNKWTDGSNKGAKALCRPYDGVLDVQRTDDRWSK